MSPTVKSSGGRSQILSSNNKMNTVTKSQSVEVNEVAAELASIAKQLRAFGKVGQDRSGIAMLHDQLQAAELRLQMVAYEVVH